jgi:broad specificity phosphatase PhoE
MNHLEKVRELKNRYFGIRHGEAENNTRGIIVSEPTRGISEFGLTDRGEKFVEDSVKNSGLKSDTLIVSSDFLRCRETAEIAKNILGASDIIFDTRLRERYFGEFENGPDGHYQDIWEADHAGPNANVHGVESAEHLMERVTAVIAELESKYSGQTFLLVSHGDPIQFLETAFAGIPIYEHQKYPLFGLAKIKELKLAKK